MILAACARRVSCRTVPRRSIATFESLRISRAEEIAKLPEVVAWNSFGDQIAAGRCVLPEGRLQDVPPETVLQLVDAGLATFAIHTEARVASLVGQGFYTIGPCGEELLGALAVAVRPTDAVALHYRHLATQLMRQLSSGRTMNDILLDRARGYAVSAQDPVTGGVHCALGGGAYDFVVTSTLASQASPAVGRALGNQLANALPGVEALMPPDAISVVSVGDGSVNNAHWLAANNMASYAQHRGFKCPVLFVITDNDVCISLKGYNWMETFRETLGMPVYEANGLDTSSLLTQAQQAAAAVRKSKKPAVLLVRKLPRRFGHAATDRQAAYYTPDEIAAHADCNPLEGLLAQAVDMGITNWEELSAKHRSIYEMAQQAFDVASKETKIENRASMEAVCSAPMVAVQGTAERAEASGKRSVMRKLMTQCLDEQMGEKDQLVYLGEDVRHGGYYVVTEGLANKYGHRVLDWPPDETSLIGAAMGFSQVGLLPIVEVPYAKYLDCGADMFCEAAVMNWLTAGKQPNGMIIRVQGFDRGVFGGNFHTHNMMHIPPGVDALCYSNGADWVRGLRYSLEQAKAGRVVMLVDCTAALNLKHVHERDNGWLRRFPSPGETMSWDEVTTISSQEDDAPGTQKIAIVSYGNGVPLALQAAKVLSEECQLQVDVIDSPYLSSPSSGLQNAVQQYDHVVFADICKTQNSPLANMAAQLHTQKKLPQWAVVAAPIAYNPLGNLVTFLSVDDVVATTRQLVD